MYSLVISSQKTQLAIGQLQKSSFSIAQLKDFPNIYLPLLHQDKYILEKAFSQLAQEENPCKDNKLIIVLTEDFFTIQEIICTANTSDLILNEDSNSLVAAQTSMSAYGQTRAWHYGLKIDIINCLKDLAKEFNFQLIAIKSSTEVLFHALGDLTKEAFILSFSTQELHVDFANGLTGLDKFSLPLNFFPEDMRDWDFSSIKKELNLHSKKYEDHLSQKFTNTINLRQQIYIINNNILCTSPKVNNQNLIQDLLDKGILKSPLGKEDLASHLLSIAAFTTLLKPKYHNLLTPPGFQLKTVNFINKLADKANYKKLKNINIVTYTLRRFCKAVFILCLFASLFMSGSIYYFNRINAPTNSQMTEYHQYLETNQKLAAESKYYQELTGDSTYYNHLVHQLKLKELGTDNYAGLNLIQFKILPGSTPQEETIITLEIQGDKQLLENYLTSINTNRFFSKVKLTDSPADSANPIYTVKLATKSAVKEEVNS